MSSEKRFFSPHNRENRMIYVQRTTFSHQNSRKNDAILLVKLCVGNVFLSYVWAKHNNPGHFPESSHLIPKRAGDAPPTITIGQLRLANYDLVVVTTSLSRERCVQ